MGLPAGGVRGVRLSGEKDRVVALAIPRVRSDLLVVTEDGRGKRSPLSQYPVQGRHGQGVVTAKFARPDTRLAGACIARAGDPVVLVTEKKAGKTIRARSAPRMGRATRGEPVITLRRGNKVNAVLYPAPRNVSKPSS